MLLWYLDMQNLNILAKTTISYFQVLLNKLVKKNFFSLEPLDAPRKALQESLKGAGLISTTYIIESFKIDFPGRF